MFLCDRRGAIGNPREKANADGQHQRLRQQNRQRTDAFCHRSDGETGELHAELHHACAYDGGLNATFGDLVQQTVAGRRDERLRATHDNGVVDHRLVAEISAQHDDEQEQRRQGGDALRDDDDPAPADDVGEAAADENQQHRRYQHRHLRDADHLRHLVQLHRHEPREHHRLNAEREEPRSGSEQIEVERLSQTAASSCSQRAYAVASFSLMRSSAASLPRSRFCPGGRTPGRRCAAAALSVRPRARRSSAALRRVRVAPCS